ncbi:MAG: hypothetical protein CL828_03400 [Crocinitomicaceae bacterium]|nr:hypothetical protein [Crocinitomicaceae bacterium]
MRFPVKLALANAMLLIAGLVTPPFAPFAYSWLWLAVVCWYFGLTFLLNRWIQTAMRRSSMQFITAVNGSTAIKMFSSLALVTAYLVFIGGTYRVHFVLGLFAVFAVNTILLVVESQNHAPRDPN